MVKGGTSRGLQVPLLLSTPRAPLCVLAPPPAAAGPRLRGSHRAGARLGGRTGGGFLVLFPAKTRREAIKPGSLAGLHASSSLDASPGAERSWSCWGATSARCLLEGGQRAKSPPAAEDHRGPKQTELPAPCSLFGLGPLPPSCAGKRGGLPAAGRPPRPPADVIHRDLSKKSGYGGKIGFFFPLWVSS